MQLHETQLESRLLEAQNCRIIMAAKKIQLFWRKFKSGLSKEKKKHIFNQIDIDFLVKKLHQCSDPNQVVGILQKVGFIRK